jgi:hypothetical protein
MSSTQNVSTGCWKKRSCLTPVADALNEELDRAQMCTPETMPHDVVTMNSQVKFRNLTTGEELTRTLVYPAQMTDSSTQLSVLAPVGAALLGLRTGIRSTGNYRVAPQPIWKCWSCSTSQKPRAITCVNLF